MALNSMTVSKDLIFDVGLHKGEDTDFYLKKGFSVVAFEASPVLVEYCRQRFSEEIAQGRLTIISGAIIDRNEILAGKKTVRFFQNPEMTVWGTVNTDWIDRNARLGSATVEAIEIPAIDFSEIIRTHGMPYFLKIDIEGCDMICVEALKDFAQRPAYLSMESEKTGFDKVCLELDVLETLGYQSFKAVEQSAVERQRMPNPSKEGKSIDHQFPPGASGLFGEESPGQWLSAAAIRARYRYISLGYKLLGDDGIAKNWQFPGAKLLRFVIRLALSVKTGNAVPGWYDTHAKLG